MSSGLGVTYSGQIPMTTPPYTPPSSRDVARSQNQVGSLRLLIAQRRLHGVAKFWAYLRMLGLGVIAVAAPVVAAVNPDLSVGFAAFAAAWFVMSRTVFVSIERRYSERGALVQEQFDRGIYGMPELGARRQTVTPEELARLSGPASKVEERAKKKKLISWYPIDERLDGADAIAIAQRANAAYSDRLLAWNASVWLGLIVLWSVVAVAISVLLGFTLEKFLIAVALPVMPPLLDTYDEWLVVRSAGKERRALAQKVQETLENPSRLHVDSNDLLLWQDQLFTLRRDSPQVPDLVYKAMRASNERAMSEAAAELAATVLAKNLGEAHESYNS